jgi:predicted PolB exonuclease-like 3'-5' exonuclease
MSTFKYYVSFVNGLKQNLQFVCRSNHLIQYYSKYLEYIYIYICSNYLDLEKTRERISEFFTHADMNKLRCQYAT